MKSHLQCTLFSLWLGLPAMAAEALEVQSPDGNLTATFQSIDGVPQWQVRFEGQSCLEPGRLGLKVGPQDFGKMETVSAEISTHRESVTMVWGKFAQHDDHYNQLLWTLRETTGDPPQPALQDQRPKLDQAGTGHVGLAGVGCPNRGRLYVWPGHAQLAAFY